MTANRAIVEIRKHFGQVLKNLKTICLFSTKKFTKKLFSGQVEGSFDHPAKNFSSTSPKCLGPRSGNFIKIYTSSKRILPQTVPLITYYAPFTSMLNLLCDELKQFYKL